MSLSTFHFYGQLNDFLPRERREVDFTHRFDHNPAIKDMIEALGVPHAEVHRMVVNGREVEFNYRLQDGDQVEVYPTASTDPVDSEIKFILDVHLGRLAAYLRLLGFDTLYRNDYDDPELAQISNAEDRVLLTRDLGLLKRSLVNKGYFVRNTAPAEQFAEIVRQFNLAHSHRPFYRCLNCNGVLQQVTKEEIIERLLPRTQQYYDEFYLCSSCSNIYWKGSHYERMQKFVDEVLATTKGAQMNSEIDSVKREIDTITANFFKSVSFKEGEKPPYENLHELFIASGLLIRNSGTFPEISTVSQFIEPRQKMVDSGELTAFEEKETAEITEIFGNVAHRLSTYEKYGINRSGAIEGRGIISIQFIKTGDGWKMSSMAWDDERPGLTIPERYK